MKVDESTRLVELDALRGIAAIMVVCFHLGMNYQNESRKIFNVGLTGVDLFFMISGFVILLTLERTKDWKGFIIGRISRLYPAYWFCVSLTALLCLVRSKLIPEFHNSELLNQYLVNLSMFQRWFNVPDIDGPYWTLSVELIFYGLMLGIFICGQIKNIERIGAIGLLFVASTHKLSNI